MDKTLKERAMLIKGKQYVMVKDRITFFNENYPSGSITTNLLPSSDPKRFIVQATVFPDANEKQSFTGLAQEIETSKGVNETSALENAETSAVGRALAMMGIGVIDSIASVDEINKATNRQSLTYQANDVPF